MTSVNVTTTKNTVTVNGETRVVTVKTAGPQGPSLPDGDKGDVTVSSNGTAISINNSAVTSAKIADGAIVDADINASAAIALSKLATGALPTAITVTSANISDLSIVDADISGSAAISLSKLATGALPTAITVTSANISDLSIVNADINASAAIAGTKISPDFGSQDITTSGHIDLPDASTIKLGDSDEFQIQHTAGGASLISETGSGNLEIRATNINLKDSNANNKLATNSLGVAITGNLDVSNGADITGNITVTGTVDGRDVATDGTKLDGIETGATADQTAAEIKTLLDSNGIVNSNVDASAAIAGTKISPDFGSQVITTTGKVQAGDDVEVVVSSGDAFILTKGGTNQGHLVKKADNTTVAGLTNGGAVSGNVNDAAVFAPAGDLKLLAGGNNVNSNLIVDVTSSGIDVTGNIAVTGTIDGRDVATDGTKLDGIETAATADQTAAEIKTLLDSNGIVNSQIDANAAIAGTKISPNFGSQNITTTGTLSTQGTLTIGGTFAQIFLQDSNDNPDYRVQNSNGTFIIKDHTNNVNRFRIGTDGNVRITNGLEAESGLDVTGNISVTGTVDGVDIAARDTLFGGLTSSSGVLTNGVTATTQSASDNSTKVATTAYTDTAIANLVDSAPGTLNTLNELASALGDDANFSTTVTNSIATKLPLAGGTLTGNLTLNTTQPRIRLNDSNNNPDYSILNEDGIFNLYDDTNSASRFTIDAGKIVSKLNHDFDAGIDVTGNITVSGTVDGRDVATDGTKLDGIEASATADQTASEIVSLLSDQDITTTGNFGAASVNITDNSPSLIFTDSANDSDFRIRVQSGVLKLRDDTNSANRLEINSSGIVTIPGNTDFGAGIDVTGNITVTGTVDGRDLATDGTKLDGIESNATANQTASEIVALVADQTIAPSVIDMEDNEKIKLGTGDDLEFSHTGSIGLIDNTDGNLHIRNQATSGQIKLQPKSGEDGINVIQDGAVELYYDHSKKFETTSTGTRTTGVSVVGANAVGMGSLNASTQLVVTQLSGNTNSVDLTVLGGRSGRSSIVFGDHDDVNVGSVRYNHSDESIDFLNNNETTSKLKITSGGNLQIPVDNSKLQLGNSQDLELYHSLNHSYIRNITNELRIGSNFLKLKNDAFTESYIEAEQNGAVELYYDASKKFETTSYGAKWTGNLLGADNQQLQLGSSGDLQLYHDGTNSYIDNANTGILRIRGGAGGSGRDIQIQAKNGEFSINAIPDGAVELYYNNEKVFYTRGDGVQVQNVNGDGVLYVVGSEGNEAIVKLHADDGDDNADKFQIVSHADNYFAIQNFASGSFENNLKAFGNGAVELYYDNSKKFETVSDGNKAHGHYFADDGNKIQLGTSQDLLIYHDGTNNYIEGNNQKTIIRNSSNNIHLQAVSGEGGIDVLPNSLVKLYFDNSAKLQTTSTGVTVTGKVETTGLTRDGDITFERSGNTRLTVDNGGITVGGDIKYNDNYKIKAGTGADLEIYHDGSNSYIKNATNSLFINSAAHIYLANADNSEYKAKFHNNSSVQLYFDNSKKLETYSGGVNIYGRVAPNEFQISDNEKAYFGTGQDLEIYHDGSNSYIANATGGLRLSVAGGSNQVQINKGTVDEQIARFIADGAVELYYDNSKKFETTGNGVAIGGSTSVDQHLHVENSSGDAMIRLRGSTNYGVLFTKHSDSSLTGYVGSGGAVNLGASNIGISASLAGGMIKFQTGGTSASNERVAINSSGMMTFDGGGSSYPWGGSFREDGSGSDNSVRLFFEGDNGVSNRTFSIMSENGKLRVSGGGTAGSATGTQLVYLASTTATSWTGGSDIRLKENITEIPNVLDKIKNYRCARFNFIGDDASDIQNIKFGFIAQDWLTDFPEVISKSTQDADDPTDTTEYYGMQYTETIPVLLKAIQELTARLEALEGA